MCQTPTLNIFRDWSAIAVIVDTNADNVLCLLATMYNRTFCASFQYLVGELGTSAAVESTTELEFVSRGHGGYK